MDKTSFVHFCLFLMEIRRPLVIHGLVARRLCLRDNFLRSNYDPAHFEFSAYGSN